MLRVGFVLLLILVVLSGVIAYPYIIPPKALALGNSIIINKATNRLYFYEQEQLIKWYRVATGRKPDATPVGDFSIVVKEANDQGLGSDDVFGTRWMGLRVPGAEDGLKYGIHGTNEPASIGEHASAGCIRMSNQDVKDLYQRAPVGTSVHIQQGLRIHRYIQDHMRQLR